MNMLSHTIFFQTINTLQGMVLGGIMNVVKFFNLIQIRIVEMKYGINHTDDKKLFNEYFKEFVNNGCSNVARTFFEKHKDFLTAEAKKKKTFTKDDITEIVKKLKFTYD